MARPLPPRAVTAPRPPELPQFPVPRWTHPLARLMALALGFDPDSGQDLIVRNSRRKKARR